MLLLDKSSLQRLSHGELLRVGAHYMVMAPPVLFLELLGDLSKGAAKELGMTKDGVAPVKIEAEVTPGDKSKK